jgi:PAS domain S-box-containing protein
MDKPKHVTVTRRLILGFSILVLIFILFGLFTIYGIHIASSLTRTIYNHPLAVSSASLQANVSITKIHSDIKDLVLFSSPSEISRSIETVNEEEKQVYTYLDIVKEQIVGNEGKMLESEARKLVANWRPIREEIIEFVRQGEKEIAAGITIGKGAKHVALLQEKMLGLTAYARQKASDFLHKAERVHSRLDLSLIIFLLLGILAFFLVTFWTIRQITSSEKELSESEERYRSLIENQTDLICRFTPDGMFVFVNQVYCHFFNKTQEELIGNIWRPLPADDDVSYIQEKLSTLSPANPTVLIENRVYSGKGDIHWIQFVNRGFFDDHGNLTEIQSVGRDITNRKKAEEKLQKSEEKYRIIAENMADIITTMDMNLRFTYISPSIRRLRGFTVKEAMEQTIDQIMPPDSLRLVSMALEEELRLEATGTANRSRTRIIELEEYKKDGSTIWVENTLSFIRDEAQKPIGILAVSRDITERRRALEELNALTSHQEALLSAIPDIIMEVDHDKVYTWANQPGYNFFGDDVIGKEAIHYFKGEQNTYEAVQPLFNGEEDVIYVESWQRRKDGKKRLLAWWCKVLKDENGNVTGGLSTARDITDQLTMQEQFRQAQKMESVGRLAGGVAHDYNNALSVIIGFTELALYKVDPAEPLRAHLDEVLSAARRATDITRQLLAFARKQTITPKVLDLDENVESMLKMLRRLIGEDIDLTWSPGASLWCVKIDPSQIDQILVNLCVNARDAIEGVGKIIIETAKVAFDKAYCADHADFVPGKFVMLAISDNGCGMDKEILDNIFEPFFTTKDEDKGTGLGLSMVYGIVKQNKGFINVYSEPGKGTTIKIYLPRHEGKAVELREESAAEIPKGRGETVLVVEDDLSILKLARKILDRLGYTVLPAGTPSEAMGLTEKHTAVIHLLVTDVVMPEMNGRELSERLQSFNPDLKCIFMSGYTANVIAHQSVLDEGVHFIQKPFTERELATIVRKVLDE